MGRELVNVMVTEERTTFTIIDADAFSRFLRLLLCVANMQAAAAHGMRWVRVLPVVNINHT